MRGLFFFLILLLTQQTKSQTYAASNFTLIANINPETTVNPDNEKYSGCWGWVQTSKNKEYAIACSHSGTYWVDISIPSTPTVCAYRPGKLSGVTWREAKTYQNYCYVISDDNGSNSLQIFDMQYLPDSVHKIYDGNSLFSRGHTLYVDRDKLYVGSVTYSNSTYSSMNVYGLANPTSPVFIRSLTQDFPAVSGVHDMYVRNDTIFASCQYQGLYVFKLTTANTFTLLGSLTSYQYSGYNHSSALTPDGKTLVFMDEVPAGLPIKIADVSNLSNIQVLNNFNQYPSTTPHNPFIVNNQYCFASCYEDGLQLYDISVPQNPVLAGYFDTYYQSGGNTGTWNDDYNGQWGCYPFFPSKVIFALDRYNGIFLLKTHLYQNAPNTVSVPGSEVSNNLKLFPNPSSDKLNLLLPERTTAIKSLIVYDSRGAETLRLSTDQLKQKNGLVELSLNGFEPGIYFTKLVSENGIVYSGRFIFQH